jgi:elongation factor 1-beta
MSYFGENNKMGNVLTVLKVIPTSPEVDRESLIEKICNEMSPEGMEVLKTEEQPLYYGLFSIFFYLKHPDSDEGSEMLNALQASMQDLDVIESVEIEAQTLMQS